MTEPIANQPAIQAFRARNLLIRAVKASLKGAGLDIRELTKELVISHPGHPESGRVYITYATAEVTLKLTTWNYLGYLDGHGPTDPGADPSVSAAKIITALTEPPAEP